MLKFLLATILSVIGFEYSFAQGTTFKWPISGKKSGEGIIARPQQYVGDELNAGNLFIAAPEGTDVICPEDGTISNLGSGYHQSLVYAISFNSAKNTFDEKIQEARNADDAGNLNKKYISGYIIITLDDGRRLHITGLTGDIPLKTGQRIRKGEIIGKVGYAFKAFDEPHIIVSLSNKKFAVDDIMTTFGLETSFKPWTGPKDFLSGDEAKEDLSVLIEAFRDCYPSLYDIVTDEQLTDFMIKSEEKCKDGISYDDFYLIVRSSTSAELVHDSHISLLTENPFRNKQSWMPNLKLLSHEGKLFVGLTQKGYEKYSGKTVYSVDGEPADSIVSRMRRICNLFDGKNESIPEETLLRAPNFVYNFDYSKKRASKIVFADGSEFTDIWFPANRAAYAPVSDPGKPFLSRYVRSLREPVHFSRLNDSTAYFALGTFELNQLQMETIEDSIKALSIVPNMVIDVRNNPGGKIEVMERLISFFIEKPTVKLNSYKKVNSNSKYASFAHSTNHSPDEVMFPEYVAFDGKDGYYDYSSSNRTIVPDSLANYPGKIYILTDESSLSAASEFPAYLVRNNRTVTIGRETGTGYHYMTADKFVDVILPNSRIQITIPLIQEVFDEEITGRTPAGRGLLPDYEVPITYEEIYTSDKDPILDKALELIKTGNGQPTYIFQDEVAPAKINNILLIFLASLIILLSLSAIVIKQHISRQKH